MRSAALLLAASGAAGSAAPPKGTVQAVYDLLDRVVPGQKQHFTLGFADNCTVEAAPCFSFSASGGAVTVTATGANELAAGIGFYMREHCNMTIGWPRGGGSNVVPPARWPDVQKVAKRRSATWSYMMNVCTHSYSLQWYGWREWTSFIDWMALSGINNVLGMTGQEEVQYKVFQHYGLSDTEIREWFNGPAFLTWSRGQNEYGNNIAGPLPRSFMKDQWNLQRQILARYRSLGIVAQLPGFQGNVPIALKDKLHDANITRQAGTGWMDSLDPKYGEIADLWMQTLIADFGTDHWYQLDGYFNGGTAPWLAGGDLPACEWSAEMKNKYVAGCDQKCKSFPTLDAAKAACVADIGCGGLTAHGGSFELRSASTAKPSPSNESAWVITNFDECRPQPTANPDWVKRGAAAYMGLNRTDPDAVWSFQGWAFVGWNTRKQEESLKGFIEATPAGKFNVIDMSTDGDGEWKKWNDAAFFGAHFIWTTLHDFGGTDALKGDISRINNIPFAAQSPEAETALWGTGFSPEGIDQNPVYYEFMIEQNWRSARVANITDHVINRAHRRYQLTETNQNVANAWGLLVESAYSQDLSVQDGTGVPHLPGSETWSFEKDRRTPTATMCKVYRAWEELIAAASAVDAAKEPFRYDLVNTGREVLAQLSTPASQNFSDALKGPLDAGVVNATGSAYVSVLKDLDALVATDTAFQIGPWLSMARGLAASNESDCVATAAPAVNTCEHFYEWNARCQLTTWNPTPEGAAKVPGGPIDYASKHWSGLIGDYYAVRADRIRLQGLKDAAAGKRAVDSAAVDKLKAQLAFEFQTSQKRYPEAPVGDAVEVSKAIHDKYRSHFLSC
eukprot:TRINITY_DN35724_c0_g1_i1.p1 TRINITY_DN35724_c0_g1~~TRINITY_DN35724_c0_g1_i1.p1  ORF type:complete len:846 (+),score=277.66 TRINITY_DN35724_c0_g1_i1:58-2595(+)